jgi:hypothetical protein
MSRYVAIGALSKQPLCTRRLADTATFYDTSVTATIGSDAAVAGKPGVHGAVLPGVLRRAGSHTRAELADPMKVKVCNTLGMVRVLPATLTDASVTFSSTLYLRPDVRALAPTVDLWWTCKPVGTARTAPFDYGMHGVNPFYRVPPLVSHNLSVFNMKSPPQETLPASQFWDTEPRRPYPSPGERRLLGQIINRCAFALNAAQFLNASGTVNFTQLRERTPLVDQVTGVKLAMWHDVPKYNATIALEHAGTAAGDTLMLTDATWTLSVNGKANEFTTAQVGSTATVIYEPEDFAKADGT